MPTVICPSCSSKLQIGDKHAGKKAQCPECNAPFMVPNDTSLPVAQVVEDADREPSEELALVTTRPAMFRNRPILFLFFVVLIAAYGLGLLLLLIWWLQCLGTTLVVTNRRTTLRRGVLAKATNEVRHQDVRNVQLYQSFFQRIFGVGRIGISSAGQSGMEIEVSGIARPERIKTIIDDHR